jgi:hypothetical protein
MEQVCTQCQARFGHEPDDISFCERMGVPAATQCPDCRMQRRLCERNTRNLYYRKCDKTGKQIISQYHAEQTFPVYGIDTWNGDGWDGLAYGRDVDFSRPFFRQYKELLDAVPHLALFNTPGTMENSDFNNCTAYLKNCYLLSESDYAEDCYYSNLLKKSKNVVDCSICYEGELCYECIDCSGCRGLQYSQECQNCSDSACLRDCQSCRDCIGCINQRQKQYMIWNKQYTKDEYETHKKSFRLDTASGVRKLLEQADAFFRMQPHRALHGERSENAFGDHVDDSKNAYRCFDVKDGEDCRHCQRLSLGCKSCMDYNSWGDKAELVYQSSSCGDHAYNIRFCSNCINVQSCDYCFECTNSSDLFGCVGLKKKKHCIFNKQYSPEEYETLKAKLIAHMKTTGEWGEFFTMDLCPFAYNEAFVMDLFPLTKDEVSARGWRWYEPAEAAQTYMGAKAALPDAIADATDDVTKQIHLCERTGKAYKIIPQELKFHRDMRIPLPRLCPDQRHKDRQARRNPYKLWERPCGSCKKTVWTSYAPERPEPIVCQECYLSLVY